ncbi:MAG TPA: hypothetical protein VK513_09140 [Terriglobales bacterium]|nr:hypothetical protein [Terriglobales bacterium]
MVIFQNLLDTIVRQALFYAVGCQFFSVDANQSPLLGSGPNQATAILIERDDSSGLAIDRLRPESGTALEKLRQSSIAPYPKPALAIFEDGSDTIATQAVGARVVN